MKAIWKFEIKEEAVIEVPCDPVHPHPQFRHVGRDPLGRYCVWIEVNTEAPKRKRRLRIFGTGWDLPESGLAYLGTIHNGKYIWHVYDEGWVDE